MRYRRVHLYGDSIFKGWALRTFDPPTDHPLFGFRSIASLANMVLAENGIADTFSYDGLGVNFGWDTNEAAAGIRARLESGDIRPGDVIVFQDAGPHCQDPDAYQAQWETMRAAAVEKHDVLAIMMTMFDYPPAPADNQYDRPFGTRTMNEATVAAAKAEMAVVGRTIVSDMNGIMDYEITSGPYRVDKYGVPMIHPDGIHPNVWGQARMTGVLLSLCGYGGRLSNCSTAKELAAANAGALAYGSQLMTPALASAEMEYMLLG